MKKKMTLAPAIAAVAAIAAAIILLPFIGAASSPGSITRHISSTSQSRVYQPESLERFLEQSAAEANGQASSEEETDEVQGQSRRTVGYRVQVFSDNNARTAKNEARSKARNISSRFPEHRTYVTYNSPYWRLRVGDFRSQNDANDLAEQIRKAFPAYAKEIRVVRDRITIN